MQKILPLLSEPEQKIKMINQAELQKMFNYQNGKLIAKTNSKSRKVGDIVGSLNSNGYLVASVKSKIYRIHRLIFMYHYGFMPKQIDHINGVRSDNRIENLREATLNQNNQNRRATAQSGVKGVYWHKQINRWIASICINKKNIHLGSFLHKDDAAQVAISARKTIHGEFARGEA